MSKNVKLIFINGIGPIIGTLQNEILDASNSIIVRNPCQFGLDEDGQMVIRDYLEGIINPEVPTVFVKSNIVSVNDPASAIADAYISAIESLEAEKSAPKLIVPTSKIII
jgi:hypothetical protein